MYLVSSNEYDDDGYLADKQCASNLSSRWTTKQRKFNPSCKLIWLKQKRGMRVFKRSFPLYEDSQIFKCPSKKSRDMIKSNLIEHKADDDCETDEEIVQEHIELCLDELKQRINEFLEGEPLKMIRNIREEFSGI